MLKQTTREKLHALVQHPDFAYISVEIGDKKMFHIMDKGNPVFYTDVNIHTEGELSLDRLIKLMPEISITERVPNRVEHSDHISFGEYARGTLEDAKFNYWSTFSTMPKEIAPAPTEAIGKIILPDSTTEWTTEEILRQEG